MININVSTPDDHQGDILRDAFIIVNNNFNELIGLVNATQSISDIDGLQTELDSLQSQIDQINLQITNLDGAIGDLQDADTDLYNEISLINANIITINNTLTNLISQVNTIDSLSEAPIDGQQYARQSGTWSVVESAGATPSLQSVIEAGNVASFNSDNTYTRLPNESDNSFTISATNMLSGNYEHYSLFSSPNNYITQVGEYNEESPYYGDRTFRMDGNLIYFENAKYTLPADEDASKGRLSVGNDNVLLYAQNQESQLFTEVGLYPNSFYGNFNTEDSSNGFFFDIDKAQFNKIVECNGGYTVINPYGTVELGTPYGNTTRFRYFTTGDGGDFSLDAGVGINANIEEGINFNTSDGTGNGSTIQLSPYGVVIQHASIEPDGGSNLYLTDTGVGIQTISQGGYLRADNLTDERIYQLPDANGVIALLSDITGGGDFIPLTGTTGSSLVTGDIEFGAILTGLKRIDGDVTKRVWFNDDGWIAMNNYNPVTGNFASVDVANGSVYLTSQLDGLSNYLNIDNDGIRTGKRLFLYDPEYSDFGSIEIFDNQFIVKGSDGVGQFMNFGVSYIQNRNANNRSSTLNFDNIETTNKSFTFPNVSGKVGVIGTVAPASATASGVVGEIRVTSTYTYTCIATNTWVRSVAATW